jgi:hypothetical protein
MTPSKAQDKPSKEPFQELGIPEEWIESLQELGYDSVEALKAVEKSGRFHQEMMAGRDHNELTGPGCQKPFLARVLCERRPPS